MTIRISFEADNPDKMTMQVVDLACALKPDLKIGSDGNVLTVDELLSQLRDALPDMDVRVVPKDGDSPPVKTTKKKRASKKKAAAAKPPADDPFNGDEPEPEPESEPEPEEETTAEGPEDEYDEALDVLMTAYGDGRADKVAAVLKKWDVQRFSEIPRDKGRELLADVRLIVGDLIP